MNSLSIKIRDADRKTLLRYKDEVAAELESILEFWTRYAVDDKQGGFYGSINNDNIPDPDAPRGIVMYSRILWAFSAACRKTREESHLHLATRAFDYILNHFVDTEFGGVYWSVGSNGNMLDSRKQVYGLAFCMYGMAEYYKTTENPGALHCARQLFDVVETCSHDEEKGGYIEAFDREWQPLTDLRLSEKDDNEKKTMNTHLHIIEAYTCLYQVWPEKKVRERIINLLELFDSYIINKQTGHLNLFMDENWEVRSSLQSFGHDIEAAWLLLESAEIVNYRLYTDHFKQLSLQLTTAATEGIDNDGGLWYEYEPATRQLVREKHSWPQAEAMVGFLNAWELTGEKKYLDYSWRVWEFIKNCIRDKRNGEWFWGVYQDHTVMSKDKAGFWKCPYHNSRACLEILRRVERLTGL